MVSTAASKGGRAWRTLRQQDVGSNSDAVGGGAVGGEVCQPDGAHAGGGVLLAIVVGCHDEGPVHHLGIGFLVDLQLVVAPACKASARGTGLSSEL